MAIRFGRLSRAAIRRLQPGERITEHGITCEAVKDGDVRYSINIMVDGQRIHRVIGRASEGVTRTQCEDFIQKARTEARQSRLSLPQGRKLHLTFGAAAGLYLKRLREIDGKDYVNNEQHIRLHLKPYFGSMRIDQISTFTLQKFQKHCAARGLKPTTTNRVLATYRRMGRKLVEWKVIVAPLPMLKIEKERNHRTYVLSLAEEDRLIEAALGDSHPYIWLFIKIGLATSLRHSEILAARFDNLDAERRRLRVKVKGGRWRDQPLSRSIADILAREREMAGDPDGWMFPSSKSPSGHIRQIATPFARCVIAAGMNAEVVTPHIMRHTAITRLASSGADLKTIQAFSGHESYEMVLRYAHAQDNVIDRALDRLESGTITELETPDRAQES